MTHGKMHDKHTQAFGNYAIDLIIFIWFVESSWVFTSMKIIKKQQKRKKSKTLNETELIWMTSKLVEYEFQTMILIIYQNYNLVLIQK